MAPNPRDLAGLLWSDTTCPLQAGNRFAPALRDLGTQAQQHRQPELVHSRGGPDIASARGCRAAAGRREQRPQRALGRRAQVALMFLTRGAMPHESLWKVWLGAANGMLPLPAVAAAACGEREGTCNQAARAALLQARRPAAAPGRQGAGLLP